MMEIALEDRGFKVTSAASRSGKVGVGCREHARESDPEMAVIYVTSHGEDEWSSHGLPKSILIVKPFAMAQLLTAVSNLLNDTTRPLED